MSLEEKVSDWFDKIIKKIPGFNGYFIKEERRENDKRLREKIFNDLDKIKNVLNEMGRRVTKSGDLSPLDEIESLRKRLEKLRDSIRYTDYGYSGFFDQKEVGEETLVSVYKVDLELIDWATNFIALTNIDTDIDEISKSIEEGFDLLNKRIEIIEGV
jgi:hypothetical protein